MEIFNINMESHGEFFWQTAEQFLAEHLLCDVTLACGDSGEGAKLFSAHSLVLGVFRSVTLI